MKITSILKTTSATLIILFFLSIIVACGKSTKGTTDDSWKGLEKDDVIFGNRNANIVIIEYFDLQCPACAAAHSSITSAWQLVKDDIALVVRHFPLTQIHANAYLAAQYLDASRDQGAFFALQSKFYEKQIQWSNSADPEDLFTSYSEELGLDIAQLKTSLEKVKNEDRIDRNIKLGEKAGVTGTPTFFINGKKMNFPRSGEELYQIIQEKKRELTDATTSK